MLQGGERLVDAIDLVDSEFSSQKNLARTKPLKSSNPLLLGKTPCQYMLNVIKQIPSHDLEQSLLFLPFHYVKRFIPILVEVKSYWYRSISIVIITRSLFGCNWMWSLSVAVLFFL